MEVSQATSLSPDDDIISISSASPLLSPNKPMTLTEWMAAMTACELEVPAEGFCFYFSLNGVKGHFFRSVRIHAEKTNNAGANFYKHNINMHLKYNIQDWISAGTAQVESLQSRYLPSKGYTDEANALDMIKAHYQNAAKAPAGKKVSKRFSAGTEEIMVE